MKIAFLGTSEFAVPALQALVDAGHDVVAVYTRAPKPAGRGQQERKTPVHRLADTLGLPVRTPKTLKTDEEAAAFKALDLDAAVVVSYGHILTRAVPRRAGAGLHQHPRLAAAALARRRADPSRDPRRRRRDRRHHHAHGRGPRHRPDAAGRTHADLRRRHGGKRARPAGGARRDADRLDARRADAPLDRSDAAARARASPTPTSSARKKACSTGGGRRPSSSARCAPSIPGPARRSRSTASRSRCWTRRWRWPAARRAR